MLIAYHMSLIASFRLRKKVPPLLTSSLSPPDAPVIMSQVSLMSIEDCFWIAAKQSGFRLGNSGAVNESVAVRLREAGMKKAGEEETG